ncbi:MAG TPA: phage baseplate assembly protein V [Povalibacter sp.]|nr:phage baseplate assembly protein V [Povalibacter sp.]
MRGVIKELASEIKGVQESDSRLFGVYVARVVDIRDPDGQGRVRVAMQTDAGSKVDTWARLATLFAGNERGSWFIPDVDDEVLVAFEKGDVRRPYVLGSLWNGNDRPPESMDPAGNNYRKVLRSRTGVQITLDDQSGQVQLATPGGQSVTLRDGPGSIEISDSNGNSVTLEASGVTVTASAKVTVQANQVAISASMLTIDAGMSKFSGVVQADTVITNSVISASYSPGAGNIW